MDNRDINALTEEIKEQSTFIELVRSELGRRLVGQTDLVDRVLVAFLTGGHILIEGVPGLAKTLTVSTVAQIIRAEFRRIQFTPDLLPSDLIGTLIYNAKTAEFETKKGPIFANIILADEINRTAPKVQSALLEAMQERQVSIGETTYPLDDPFLVLATQNPIEQEGTYPLPEAQIDRFMLKTLVGYPGKDEEKEIVRRAASSRPIEVSPVVDLDTIRKTRDTVERIYVDEKIIDYIVSFVEATRHPDKYGLDDLTGLIAYGASPRASIYLSRAARGLAFIHHRGFVTPDDVRALLPDVLRHRLILSFEAEAEEWTADKIITKVMETLPVP